MSTSDSRRTVTCTVTMKMAQYVTDTSGHSAYWTPDSISLKNQAAVVVGEYSLVSVVHGVAPPDIS